MDRSKYQSILLLAGLTTIIVMRSLPLLAGPLNTYGYDYGFYLYALNHPPTLNIFNLIGSGWGGYNNPLLFLLHYLPAPAPAILNLSFFLITVGVGASVFYFYKRRSTQAAVVAVALFAFSIAQNQTYLMFLWKNQLALIGLILAFAFLIQKRYLWFSVASLLVLLTHRTTSIVLILTCGLYLLFEQVRAKKWKYLTLEFGGVILLLAVTWSKIWSSVNAFMQVPNRALIDGVFLTSINYWLSALPYLLLAIPGLYFYIKKERHALLPIFVIVTTVWTLLRLPFYNRMVIYVDFGLILLAAYAVANIFRGKIWKMGIFVTLLLITGFMGVRFLLQSYPLISLKDVAEIQEFSPIQPGSFVLALNGNDAPWLLGYLKNSRLGAPGLFEDGSSYEQWLRFWAGESQETFLQKYPQPLYVYERSFQLHGPVESCLISVSRFFYKFNCGKPPTASY